MTTRITSDFLNNKVREILTASPKKVFQYGGICSYTITDRIINPLTEVVAMRSPPGLSQEETDQVVQKLVELRASARIIARFADPKKVFPEKTKRNHYIQDLLRKELENGPTYGGMSDTDDVLREIIESAELLCIDTPEVIQGIVDQCIRREEREIAVEASTRLAKRPLNEKEEALMVESALKGDYSGSISVDRDTCLALERVAEVVNHPSTRDKIIKIFIEKGWAENAERLATERPSEQLTESELEKVLEVCLRKGRLPNLKRPEGISYLAHIDAERLLVEALLGEHRRTQDIQILHRVARIVTAMEKPGDLVEMVITTYLQLPKHLFHAIHGPMSKVAARRKNPGLTTEERNFLALELAKQGNKHAFHEVIQSHREATEEEKYHLLRSL